MDFQIPIKIETWFFGTVVRWSPVQIFCGDVSGYRDLRKKELGVGGDLPK